MTLSHPQAPPSSLEDAVRLVALSSLTSGSAASRFEGRDHGSSVSFFVTHHPPGTGPALHRHPYDETFIIQEGTATFTVGEREIEAGAGHVVVVPAGVAHGFVNSGEDVLRQVSIHPRDHMEQEFLDGATSSSNTGAPPVARVIPVDEVRYTPAVAVFEGHEDAPVSFYVTDFERGEGPPLHFHPYPEVFLVERNSALFTAGEEELTVTAGHFVVVPAYTPHRYVGASNEAVRVVSVQPSGTVQQTNL